jgi:hypothetical protein
MAKKEKLSASEAASAAGLASAKARNKQPLCGAKRRSDGKKCRNFAGFKTDHAGVGRCFLHGGSTRTHKRHAVKVEAERLTAREFGKPKRVMPGAALMEMLETAYGLVHWLANELAKHKDLTTFEARVLVQAHAQERDRVAHIAKTALDAGVQERQILLAERWGELIARAIEGILGDLNLTSGQKQSVPTVVRRHLMLMAGDPEEQPVLDPPTVEGKAKRAAKAN